MAVKRKIGSFEVNPLGLGCMSLSAAYDAQPDEGESAKLLHHALDLGCDFLDTAAIYGNGHNETLIGRVLKERRAEYVLASKCGFRMTGALPRVVDGSPGSIHATLERSLAQLQVDHIDLYYLHRPDPVLPIEESVGALARAVEAGKIGAIGLSEVSADQLRRAHAVHPIAALQTEYSLWTRNPEIAGLAACRELGVTFVAFSPVGRGFLAGSCGQPDSSPADPIRATMPRFRSPSVETNRALFARFRQMAVEIGCTPAQLSLAWLLHRDPDLLTIPGTRNIAHMEENMAADRVVLSAGRMAALDALFNPQTVSGSRYGPAMQATVTTEEFA